MNERFSAYQIRFLRVLARGRVPYAVWRKWDQRPIRAMFLRSLFTLTRQLDADITDFGWQALQSCSGAPKTRSNPKANTFVESNDRRLMPKIVSRRVQ